MIRDNRAFFISQLPPYSLELEDLLGDVTEGISILTGLMTESKDSVQAWIRSHDALYVAQGIFEWWRWLRYHYGFLPYGDGEIPLAVVYSSVNFIGDDNTVVLNVNFELWG